MSQRSWRKCVICNIREHGNVRKHIFFTSFPSDEARCKEWLRLVGNEELVHLPIEKLHKTRYICEDHFEAKALNRKRNRLKNWAVPKLNLTAAPLTDDQLSEFPQHMWSWVPPTEEKDCTKQHTPSLASMASSKNSLLPGELASTSQSSPLPSAVAEVNASLPGELASTSQSSPLPSAVAEVNASLPGELASTSQSSPLPSAVAEVNASLPGELASTSQSSPLPSAVAEVNELTPRKRKSVTKTTTTKATKRKRENNIEITPRKKKLMEQLQKTKCTLASLKKSAKLLENIESPILKEIVDAAVKNQKRKLKGRRWTTKNKISALAIFKRSPKTYKYLRNLIPLPSIKTLQNILRKVPMEPGINNAVIDQLANLAKHKDLKNKICGLVFDEIALKPRLIYNPASDQVDGFEDLGGHNEEGMGRSKDLADHALVFMVQGIYQKFKQPIVFYFVKGTISSQKLTKIIKEVIRAINATGYKVITTICDQGPTNMGALKLLRDFSGHSEDNFFTIDNEKVFIIYDIPHLFKSLRNNFLKNGTIFIDGKKAKWAHLVKVEEKNRAFLFLSKISQTHIEPKYRAKMKVKLAAQILSNTVSAVLKLMSQAETESTLANELMESALVVQELDRLFDFTNGPSCHDDIKKGLRENVSAKTTHLDMWVEFIKKLSTLKFINENTGLEARNVKCIQGYITSLKSLRNIWMVANSLHFKYLNLRQLNQDALENLFGVIRQHSPTNRNPTCAHFMAALKTTVISRLTAPHSRGSNCENDNKSLLTDFHDLIFPSDSIGAAVSSHEAHEEEVEEDSKNEALGEEAPGEYPVLSLPDDDDEFVIENDLENISEQAVVYVSGYIAFRTLGKKTNTSECKECAESLKIENPDPDDPVYRYITLREWWGDRLSLTYPTKGLCHLVQLATKTIEQEICPRLHDKHICQLTVTLLMAKCDTSWFGCSAHKDDIFKSIFVRLAHLLIRRQCQRRNLSISILEENLADANKKAQQQGIAK